MESKEVKNKETKKDNNTSSKSKKNSTNKNKTSNIKENKTNTVKKKNNSKKDESKEVKNNNNSQKKKTEKELETKNNNVKEKKKNDEVKIADEKNEVKKEVETKITSKEINLVPKDNKLVKNEFTSTIDIKEIIKAIPKKTHKKEEVENAIADIFDVDYDSSKKEKNKKLEDLLEKTQDISIIREEIKKTETSTKEINKKDEYIIDEINPILTSDNSSSDLKIDLPLNDEFEINKKTHKKNIWIIISAILTILLITIVIFLIHHFNTAQHDIIVKENKILDDNYVFVGDSITELYKLDDYYEDFKVVNSGKSGYKTTDILDNIDTMVYDYNPTKIFLLIGTNDFLDKDVNPDEVYENITKIIENIQKNRKYAKIYVESIYPTCHHDDEKVNLSETNKRPNKEIKKINKNLENYCKDNNITFIDIYSKLIDEEGELNLDYTVDGLHLSKEGYDIVSKTLMPYIKEKVEY